MALKFWDTVIHSIYNDVEDTFRKDNESTKVHTITVTTAQLERYIKHLSKSIPNLDQKTKDILDNDVINLTNDLYNDLKYNVEALGRRKDSMTQIISTGKNEFTFRSIGVRDGSGFLQAKRAATSKFIMNLKRKGATLNKRVKDSKGNDTTQDVLMKKELEFSHSHGGKMTTIGTLQGLRIFKNMTENVENSLKGKGYDTSIIKNQLQEDLIDYFQHTLKIDIYQTDATGKGKFHDNYTVYGTLEHRLDNAGKTRGYDANEHSFGVKLRKEIAKSLKKNVQNKDIAGSPKLSDRAADAVIAKFRKKIKAKGAKVVGGKKVKTITGKRSTGPVKNTSPAKGRRKKGKAGKKIAKTPITNMAGVGTGLLRQQQKQKTKRSNIALAGLMTRLNSALPYMVRENMGSPKLNYRGTGREGPFTSTVRVTGVTPMNRKNPEAGGVNINYTYGLYPYQTFEPGFEQGDFYRDPRKLIEESIFELARNIKSEYFMRGIAMRRTATGRDYNFKRGK